MNPISFVKLVYSDQWYIIGEIWYDDRCRTRRTMASIKFGDVVLDQRTE